MTEDADGTLTVSLAECKILADACVILDELLAAFPPDYPVSEPLMAALCREARRRADIEQRGN